MRTAEEMIMELDSALNFNDVQKLMKQYAKESLNKVAEKVANMDWNVMNNDVDAKKVLLIIANTINELK